MSDYTSAMKAKMSNEKEFNEWKGFWVIPETAKAVKSIETEFEPHSTDIILASFPKTGTTWLKALTTTLLNYQNSKRDDQDLQVDDPLLTKNPHELVPFIEIECFGENPTFDISKMMSSPRIFSTHLPYSMLPENIKKSGCKIVYITRNPMDTFVSYWHFFNKHIDCPLDEAFRQFCQGTILLGPYFDHVLEYWKSCNEMKSMLFLTYEGLKRDPDMHVKRLAQFLGCSLDEKEIEQVVWRCSYNRLASVDVNKDTSKHHWSGWDFSSYFRRGIVGDSINYLTTDMVEQLKELATQKWEGSGLKFQSVDEMMNSSD